MDAKTAQHVVTTQADMTASDSFLVRLQQQSPPVPGQVTSLLLALKVISENLKTAEQIERSLAYSLHQLAYESRQAYEQGRQARVEWPPLLDADIERIAIAVAQIFKGPDNQA
ncbi:MAG: Dethiobiotin synthetase [Leptolyngbyaceae cyanobacterium]